MSAKCTSLILCREAGLLKGAPSLLGLFSKIKVPKDGIPLTFFAFAQIVGKHAGELGVIVKHTPMDGGKPTIVHEEEAHFESGDAISIQHPIKLTLDSVTPGNYIVALTWRTSVSMKAKSMGWGFFRAYLEDSQ